MTCGGWGISKARWSVEIRLASDAAEAESMLPLLASVFVFVVVFEVDVAPAERARVPRTPRAVEAVLLSSKGSLAIGSPRPRRRLVAIVILAVVGVGVGGVVA